MRIADLIFAFLLSNNVLFSHFLGLSELLGPVSFQKIARRSLILGVLMVFSGGLFWGLSWAVLQPFHLSFLTTITAVASLAAGYWLYIWLRRSTGREASLPDPQEFLFHTLLFGGVLLAVGVSRDPLEFLAVALASVLGYSLGLILLHAVFLRMARERIPITFQGLPFQLFTLGLVWLVLSGLDLRFAGNAG
ncbi:MAG: hypothetical protein WCG80_12410 [Spirochaetales bacterium]